jgi:hydroxyethylthiazole kinase-like sugar kinase family protein
MKPFLQGRRAHNDSALRAPHVHKTAPLNGEVRSVADGSSVEVVKEGDKIVRIIVTCGCGEKVEVECLYPPGG